MVPGSNLLNAALTIIARQSITYFRAVNRVQNDIGQDVTIFAAPVTIEGSFQAVPKSLYEIYGLDLAKTYFTLYTSNNVIDVQRNIAPDQISFKDKRYQCLSANDWFEVDGWKGVLCVLLTNPEPISTAPVFGFGVQGTLNGNFNFNNGNFKATT